MHSDVVKRVALYPAGNAEHYRRRVPLRRCGYLQGFLIHPMFRPQPFHQLFAVLSMLFFDLFSNLLKDRVLGGEAGHVELPSSVELSSLRRQELSAEVPLMLEERVNILVEDLGHDAARRGEHEASLPSREAV